MSEEKIKVQDSCDVEMNEFEEMRFDLGGSSYLYNHTMKRIYLDYAATTPVDKRVVKAMSPYFTEKFGNTMSIHSFGQEAKLVLENSRETVVDLIGAKSNEIIFTGSATESNNMVLKGVKKGHIIIVHPRDLTN